MHLLIVVIGISFKRKSDVFKKFKKNRRRGNSMKKQQRVLLTTLCMLASLVRVAYADEGGRVELTMLAEKEIVSVNEQGAQEIQYVVPSTVIPGDVILYTVAYVNKGDESAENTYITNKIPDHMVYMENSASGLGTEIRYSVDDGQSFDLPHQLMIHDSEGKARLATTKDYTHIRWLFTGLLDPGSEGKVFYRARLN